MRKLRLAVPAWGPGLVAGLLLGLMTSGASAGDGPWFEPIPFWATAISPDGSTVGGRNGNLAYIWRRGEGSSRLRMGRGGGKLYNVTPTALSVGGDVVVGNGHVPGEGYKPIRWVAKRGALMFPDEPGHIRSFAYDVSADGRVVVGSLGDGSVYPPARAFRWTEDEGASIIAGPADARPWRATAVSADGSVIAGDLYTQGPFDGTDMAFRWTDEDGIEPLGWLPADRPRTNTYAISADGSTVVGTAASTTYDHREIFRWRDGELQGLGPLNPQFLWTEGRAVSADGSIVFGHEVNSVTALIWTEDGGMRSADSYFRDKHGLDLGDWRIERAIGMSDDGRTFLAAGNFGSLVVHIPTPGTALTVLVGLVPVAARRRRSPS